MVSREERFERLREVGAGASGVVYQARDSVDGGLVALKVLHADKVGVDARFGREAAALADLRHPGIVGLSLIHI